MCIAEPLAHIVAVCSFGKTGLWAMCSFGKTGLSTIRWIRFFMNCQPQSIDSIVYVYTCTDTIRLRVRFDQFTIFATSWTALENCAPIGACQHPHVFAPTIYLVRPVSDKHLGTDIWRPLQMGGVSGGGARHGGFGRLCRRVGCGRHGHLGSCKLISNHYADYGL